MKQQRSAIRTKRVTRRLVPPPPNRLMICFHGTTAQNAATIVKEGFQPWSWFALHLEDAITFGGANVFEVTFLAAPIEARAVKGGASSWQFRNERRVPATRIVRHIAYSKKILCENNKLVDRIFRSNGG